MGAAIACEAPRGQPRGHVLLRSLVSAVVEERAPRPAREEASPRNHGHTMAAALQRHCRPMAAARRRHGAAMAVALGELVHGHPTEWARYQFANCSLTQLRLGEDDGPAQLLEFNSYAHRLPFR